MKQNNMHDIYQILEDHPFFKGFTDDEIKLFSECGHFQEFKKDEILAKENQLANVFYLISKGHVGVCTAIPNRESKIIQTVGPNEVFGWSWLFPPYRWMFEAVALESVECVVMNGQFLRAKLDQDPSLGYRLMKQFSLLIVKRLNATRLQLLDIYGTES